MSTILNSLLDSARIIGLEPALHGALYPLRKAWTEARWENPSQPRTGLRQWLAFGRHVAHRRPRWPKHWEPPGRVRLIVPTERGAVVITDKAEIEITLFAADLVRVRYRPHSHDHVPEPIPYAIAKPLEQWEIPDMVDTQTQKAFLLHSESLTIGVALKDAQIFIANAAGNLIRADVDVGWDKNGAIRHRTVLDLETHLFGLGERATPGNRYWRTHILWNSDPAGYTNDNDPINLNIPVYVGMAVAKEARSKKQEAEAVGPASYILHPASFLVFYENPFYAEFDLGDTTPNIADHRFAGGELRYYVTVGSPPHLLERYTELTGWHELPPLWMLGYQQSRWSYYPGARVRKLAQDFRDHDVPCDAIHLDIHYMDGYRCFTTNKECFPNLPQLADDLRQQGIKLITIIDPAIKKDRRFDVYRSGVNGDHFCTTPDSRVYHAPVWPGLSAFPDFTAPQTRIWWGALYKPLVDAGIAGFWNDMNEPSAFALPSPSTLPAPVRHSLEGRTGDHREAHNLYGMQMARASRDGLHALQPGQRPVLITRSGWAGVQRYATSWTGDNESTWASLRLTVPMVTALGLSGLGFTGPDVGGFSGKADGELFTRWVQMSTFMPFFRAHTISGTPDQEPWSYGEPFLSIVRRFIQLRYELLPYLYTAVWQMVERGWPVVRPLWWAAEDDPALWDVDNAFLCGDALLVAPVGEPGVTSRSVPLPPGTWYNFWTNEVHSVTDRQRLAGSPVTSQSVQSVQSVESVETFASLETLPLFVRAGTVLPMGEFGPSVEQRVQKFLRLGIYPLAGPGETNSEFYEDDGESLDYRHGESRHNRFRLQQTEDRLTVTWTHSGTYEPPYEHIELTLHGLKRAPRDVLVDGESYPVVATDPVRRTALLGVPPFKKVEVVL